MKYIRRKKLVHVFFDDYEDIHETLIDMVLAAYEAAEPASFAGSVSMASYGGKIPLARTEIEQRYMHAPGSETGAVVKAWIVNKLNCELHVYKAEGERHYAVHAARYDAVHGENATEKLLEGLGAVPASMGISAGYVSANASRGNPAMN